MLPLRYRESGTTQWHVGSTINISRTGILFETDQDLPLQTPLQVQIEMHSPAKVMLICRGPVVRKQDPKTPGKKYSLAATIRACCLLPELLSKAP
jgi:hypothetical protein